MDKIAKALQKLSKKEQEKLKEILRKLDTGDFAGLDIKKLKGRKDIFRVRQGDFRIIFQKTANCIKILTLEQRQTNAYRKR